MQGERGGPAPDGLPDPGAGSDREVQRLAAGGGLNIAAGLVNQGCLFGVTILLARQLGSSDVGTYAQAFAIRQLLVLMALGGMRSAMTRYVAIHRADDDPAALRGTIRFGLAFTVGTSVVFGVALFAASHWLAFDAFNDPAHGVGVALGGRGPALGLLRRGHPVGDPGLPDAAPLRLRGQHAGADPAPGAARSACSPRGSA